MISTSFPRTAIAACPLPRPRIYPAPIAAANSTLPTSPMVPTAEATIHALLQQVEQELDDLIAHHRAMKNQA